MVGGGNVKKERENCAIAVGPFRMIEFATSIAAYLIFFFSLYYTIIYDGDDLPDILRTTKYITVLIQTIHHHRRHQSHRHHPSSTWLWQDKNVEGSYSFHWRLTKLHDGVRLRSLSFLLIIKFNNNNNNWADWKETKSDCITFLIDVNNQM